MGAGSWDADTHHMSRWKLAVSTSLNSLQGTRGCCYWSNTQVVNTPPQPRALARPCNPQRAEPRGGGALQDECLIPHWAEGLVYDLGAMDLVFRDEIFDHSLHPPLVVGMG